MSNISQAELDWLAEGEMESSERDDLFARLDADPAEWKRCALALLERQAISNSLNGYLPDPQASPSQLDKNVIAKNPRGSISRSSWLRKIGLAVSLAAVMFCAGFATKAFSPADSASNVEVSENNSTEQLNENRDEQQPGPKNSIAIQVALESSGVTDSQILALVSTSIDDQAVFVPVITSETLARQYFELPPPQVPRELTRKMSQSGYRVTPRRQFLSVNQKDGSNTVFPVDVLGYQYVGKSVF